MTALRRCGARACNHDAIRERSFHLGKEFRDIRQ
jgi:hypothetical protein